MRCKKIGSAFELGNRLFVALLVFGLTIGSVGIANASFQETQEPTAKSEKEESSDRPEVETKAEENADDETKEIPKTNIKTPDDPSQLESTIGFPKLIYQKVIEGPKLIAKPIRDKGQPVIVRIVDTYPHVDHFRYDIEYRGLEPGEHNISDYLMREDGSDVDIAPLNVKVNSILGEGQVVPYELPPQKSRYSSYYLPLMLALGAAWVAGLLMIVFYGRGKKRRPIGEEKKVTVAERIKPLLDAAAAGELDSGQQAELERVLSSFWSKKLRLEHLDANQLRQKLRSHDEASVLLEQIDTWIHKPNGNGSAQVDVNQILEPYRTMNYEEVS